MWSGLEPVEETYDQEYLEVLRKIIRLVGRWLVGKWCEINASQAGDQQRSSPLKLAAALDRIPSSQLRPPPLAPGGYSCSKVLSVIFEDLDILLKN